MRGIKRGMTLLEIVIAMILTVIVITFTTSFFGTIIKNMKGNNDEFNMQSAMRNFSGSIKTEIINSPTIYLIDKEQFTDDKIENSPYWNYLGVKDVTINGKKSSQLVWYLYDADTNSHRAIEITQAVENITYDALFEKSSDDINDSMIKFKLEGFINKKSSSSEPNEIIESLLKAQNANQVIDWSRHGAVAIAYRADELEITGEESFSGAGMISFVMDTSGSMRFDLETGIDGDGVIKVRRRTYALRKSMEKLIDNFADNDNMFFTLNPFGPTAHDIHKKINTSLSSSYNNSYGRVYRLSNNESDFGENDLSDLYKIFDSDYYVNNDVPPGVSGDRVYETYDFINPSDGTNVGDGLRYAKSFKNNDLNNIKEVLGLSSVDRIKNFLILLTDGVATTHQAKDRNATAPLDYFFLDDYDGTSLTVGEYVIYGRSLEYAVEVAKKIRNETPFDDYYFIALGDAVDITSFYDIAEGFGLDPNDSAFNETHMFDANTIDELDVAFERIYDDINMNMEYLLGPKR